LDEFLEFVGAGGGGHGDAFEQVFEAGAVVFAEHPLAQAELPFQQLAQGFVVVAQSGGGWPADFKTGVRVGGTIAFIAGRGSGKQCD
jgi:hypothetical protein